jgi:hypothetical protein
MKIARFKRLGEASFEAYGEEGCFMERIEGYVRLTEYAEVEFVPLRSEDVIQKQLNALAGAEKELRNQFQEALNRIEHERSNLLALAYFPTET